MVADKSQSSSTSQWWKQIISS